MPFTKDPLFSINMQLRAYDTMQCHTISRYSLTELLTHFFHMSRKTVFNWKIYWVKAEIQLDADSPGVQSTSSYQSASTGEEVIPYIWQYPVASYLQSWLIHIQQDLFVHGLFPFQILLAQDDLASRCLIPLVTCPTETQEEDAEDNQSSKSFWTSESGWRAPSPKASSVSSLQPNLHKHVNNSCLK